MNAALTGEVVLTPCPSWCTSHYGAEKPGDIGGHFNDRVEATRLEREGTQWQEPVWTVRAVRHFEYDRTPLPEVLASADTDGGLTPAEARAMAAALIRAADLLDEGWNACGS